MAEEKYQDNEQTQDEGLNIGDLPPQTEYTEDNIRTLDSLTHIRERSGMYIGRMGDGSHADDGVYIMFKEVVDNAVDEFIMGYGRRVDITASETEFTIRDYGRGIPLGKLVDCVSKINTGGKFNTGGYMFSVGMNGVGTKAVNALSSLFEITSCRDGRCRKAVFHAGHLQSDEEFDAQPDEKNGTTVHFVPDATLFPHYKINLEEVEKRVNIYTYLNIGLSIYLNGVRYYSKNGLLDLLMTKLDEGASLYPIIHYKDKELEFAFCHIADTGEHYFSFVNGQYTIDGGTHLSAFKGGLTRAINEHYGKTFDPKDLRDGILGTIAIKIQDPHFESQTKNKLDNTDIKGWIEQKVKQAVIDYLLKHTEDADLLLEKIQKNEQLRKEIQQIQKKASAKAKSISLRNSKLKDCRHHFGDRSKLADQTMIFLTEGDSAASSIITSRNADYQAVFALRGKVFNTFGQKINVIYDHEELYYVMRTLGIEEDTDDLRYSKIVIATDADVDGLHIRNLLLTFFLQYFESLVISGHVYILETPLFRVRDKQDKKKTYYCYSEQERDDMAKKLGKAAEITRFKGLGEISPKEFKQFIGDDIRLEPIRLDNTKGIHEMLKFYMGDNDKSRWEHIQKNLV